MAIGTPFHPRTSPLCRSQDWRLWSGHYVASSYDEFVQPEYAAIRHAAALIDVSPLYKYEVGGKDAVRLLNRVVTQNVAKLGEKRATYTPWCNADGKVRQEGTLFRLDEGRFQVNAAEPALAWLHRNAPGHDVEIVDRSADTAVLALQGPHARAILVAATDDAAMETLKFFRLDESTIEGVPVMVSRTGYTGDLGYEIWLPAADALTVWDALLAVGEPYHITPCGLAAMDIARLETGFVLINVDYVSAEAARLESETVTPYDMGLAWAVKLEKDTFIGKQALEEKPYGDLRVVGLEIDWETVEAAYAKARLMPELPLLPCREPVPVYSGDAGLHAGRATTRVWSTLLKKFIALATVEARYAEPGTELAMEVTVNFRRERARARVAKPPFYRPDRLRS